MPSLYELSVVTAIRNLQILLQIIKKGCEHTEVSNDQLANSRLIDDMGNFIFQIHRVTDTYKFIANGLAKAELQEFEYNETTMEEAQARIEKTIKLLEGVKESDIVGDDDEVVFVHKEHRRVFTGKSYVLDFVLPNFYFHFTMAYALLRKEGVNLGKRDYLGL